MVTLQDVEQGTHLHYEADIQMGGKLAQLGGRLLQGAASSFANQFFADFAAALTGSTDTDTRARFESVPRAASSPRTTRTGEIPDGAISWKTFALAGWGTRGAGRLSPQITILRKAGLQN